MRDMGIFSPVTPPPHFWVFPVRAVARLIRCSELLLGSTFSSTLGSTLDPSIVCHSIQMLPIRTPTRGLLSPHFGDMAKEQFGSSLSALAPNFSPFPLTLPGSPLAQGPLKALKHLLAHRKLTHACSTMVGKQAAHT